MADAREAVRSGAKDGRKPASQLCCVAEYNLAPFPKPGIMDGKKAEAFAPAFLLIKSVLLNCDDTLHV